MWKGVTITSKYKLFYAVQTIAVPLVSLGPYIIMNLGILVANRRLVTAVPVQKITKAS